MVRVGSEEVRSFSIGALEVEAIFRVLRKKELGERESVWVSWDGMGERVWLLWPCFTSHRGPGGSSIARKGHLEVQRGDLQQSMPVRRVLEAQGTNQSSPMGPRRLGRKSGHFSPGLDSLSAPNGKGKNGCGGLGIISVLEVTRGGFLVYLGVQQCAPAPNQGFSFLAGQQGENRSLLLGELFLPFPGSPVALLCLFLGLFTAQRALSDGNPWTSGH